MIKDFEAVKDCVENFLENIFDDQTRCELISKRENRSFLRKQFLSMEDRQEETAALKVISLLDGESLGNVLSYVGGLASDFDVSIYVWERYLEAAIIEGIFDGEGFYSLDEQRDLLDIFPELLENEIIGEFSRKLDEKLLVEI